MQADAGWQTGTAGQQASKNVLVADRGSANERGGRWALGQVVL